jgi:hypothetical protein
MLVATSYKLINRLNRQASTNKNPEQSYQMLDRDNNSSYFDANTATVPCLSVQPSKHF